nr:transposase [Lachnospiraceae bacterium]
MEEELLELPSDIPVWNRFLLSIYEAAAYYHIGEKKIRALIDRYPDAEFILYVGNKALIKRRQFEEFLDNASTI